MHRSPTVLAASLLACASVLLSACGSPTTSRSVGAHSHAVLQVVAAENTWGSLASQLGGGQVHVTSIISDPNADPHEYESSAADARIFETANVVVVNGVGYDSWATKLLSTGSDPGRVVLDIGTLVGKKAGDNPHLWYDPNYVLDAMKAITATYDRAEPAEKAYFATRLAVVQKSFGPYRKILADIRAHDRGAKVAATESIFQYLAEYLDLDLVTPYSFMQAVSEGTDPPASSVVEVDRQISDGHLRVLVYNIQTVTPLTTSIRADAASHDIPVVAVSETIQPPIASFQDWMVGQLDELANALAARQLGK